MEFRLPIILMVLMLSTGISVHGQASSRNGYWIPNHDTLRIFLVFAEATDDADDTYFIDTERDWQRGEMPKNADEYFDWKFNGAGNIKSRITRFFYQASFGEFVLLGDYYPELIQVPREGLMRFGDEAVMEQLNLQTGDDITTAHGLHFNGSDFDRWTNPTGHGMPKEAQPDGYVDFLMIIWRVNSTVSRTNNGGSVNVNKWEYPFKGMKGFMDRSRFVSKYSSGEFILQHEFSHSLYGGNNFHTGGRGAGNSAFVSAMGGYSNLSSYGSNSKTWNGWDRHRMGWKSPDKQYYISALCPESGNEIATDLAYGENPGGCLKRETGFEVLLRDFVNTGDVVRIELPYLKLDNDKIRRQYLWLENHQILPGNVDHNPETTPGIYAYIQVGRDDTASFRGTGNYTAPLNGFGHYDFDPDFEAKALHLRSGRENPFTGYHFSMIPAYNTIEPNVGRVRGDTVLYSDMIFRPEMFYVEKVFIRGQELPPEDFNYDTHPALGTVYDAFVGPRKIGLTTNPAAVPVLTYEMRYNNTNPPYEEPREDDNRTIWLNGLSIEIGKTRPDGSIHLSVRYDDFEVSGHQRWCGPMELVEQIRLKPSAGILIDLGLSPVRPNAPIEHSGEKVFADPSRLHLRPGSYLEMGEKSTITLDNLSSVLASSGSAINMTADSKIILKKGTRLTLSGCSLTMAAGACIEVRGGATLEMDSTVQIKAESKAFIRVKKGGVLNLAKPEAEYECPGLIRAPRQRAVKIPNERD